MIAIIILNSPAGHLNTKITSSGLDTHTATVRFISGLTGDAQAGDRFCSLPNPAYMNMDILLKPKEELVLSTKNLLFPLALAPGSRRIFCPYLCPVQCFPLQKEKQKHCLPQTWGGVGRPLYSSPIVSFTLMRSTAPGAGVRKG